MRKVPPGTIYVRAENPKGEMGYYIVSQGGRIPYRVKIRSASFSNISIMSKVAVGQLITTTCFMRSGNRARVGQVGVAVAEAVAAGVIVDVGVIV